ncbi:LOW QUALITY PROTEIN: histamine H2 receptor-like [Amphiura filiformis]|uniref:LOW QUALITY PROTEIN: histamine H2 receptor-like n=1 Tax=Amphiura filiformis TaxID=82378 RepID=UPI003B20C478
MVRKRWSSFIRNEVSIKGYPRSWEPFDIEDITWISIVLGAIVIVTIVGNIFVMIAFARDPKIKNTVSNLFILNLSITDCIIGFAILPIDTPWVFLGNWPYGEIFCQIWLVIDFTATYMSVLLITLISLDRFWLVTKKLRYSDFQIRRQENNRHRKAAITLAMIVGVFLICWLPYFAVTIYTSAICDDCVSVRLWAVVNYMLWCNSTINPFLYAVTNIHYRRNFARFLGIHKCVKPKREPTFDVGTTSSGITDTAM